MTIRTKAELLTIFADNTSGDISAEDMRDFVETFYDGHAYKTNNPHSVTASQVGNSTAQWNADSLQGYDVAATAPSNGYALIWNNGAAQWEPQAVTAGAGGSNTQIQFNSSGSLAGDSGFTTNGSGSLNITGDLDIDNININGNNIISTDTDGNINITPNGDGNVVLDGLSWPIADGTGGYVLTTDGLGALYFAAAASSGGTYQGRSPNTYAIEATNEGSTSGDNRGEYSVDLQTKRAASTQVASGAYAIVAGGYGNTASGDYTMAIGGLTVASGNFAISSGFKSIASMYGQKTHAAGIFSANGDAQSSEFVLRNQTTNNTPTVLFLDGSSAKMTLSNDSTWMFNIFLVARRTDSNDEGAAYKFEGVIDRNATAATTAIIGGVSKMVISEDTADWDVTVDADTTNGALRITVTGENAKTINWVAHVRTVEVVG